MCGLAGWLGHVDADAGTTASVLEALAHRGPDAQDAKQWPDCTLLFARLRIIDLSATGEQPMSNEDGSVWTVFNGEIYNHRELQQELESKGHRFRGRSDTEVIPHLYEEYGDEMFSRLRGMFGIAVLDRARNRMLLARDRFGIKPLFYSANERFVAFASELNALRLIPGIDLTPNAQAIADYASLFYIPAPDTFFTGISALCPGEALVCSRESDGRVTRRLTRFHSFSPQRQPSIDLGSAIDKADELLEAGVTRQLESDVPLGSLLSGGIDSSLVSAFAMRKLTDLNTFSVRMPDPDFDETWAAEAVARHIGSRHETLDLGGRKASWDDITCALRHAGQPFADSSMFAVDAVSEAMRRRVTVALSGDGGDEGFGGYDLYGRLPALKRLQRMPDPLWSLAASLFSRTADVSQLTSSANARIRDFRGADDVAIVQALFSWIRPHDHERLLVQNRAVDPTRRLFEPQWPLESKSQASALERLSALAVEANVRLQLPNDFLFKVDIASMRHSLEVRVPLLDEDLMDAGLSLPHRLRVHRGKGKRVLRAIASRYLPEPVVERRKQGFALPVDVWVSSDFKRNLRAFLLDSNSLIGEHLTRTIYEPWVQAFCDGEDHRDISRLGLYQRAIMLLALELWLRDPSPRSSPRSRAVATALVDGSPRP
ncbi:MAG: asparagine synthase (glutamine-hydrolyzing) [Gaiella sp.]|nr:asparagine synthase (glutamine-hydrolyzing) [Gaiella sp.]